MTDDHRPLRGPRLIEQDLAVDPGAAPAPQYLQDKHYMRKHGPNAYYGQKK